MNIIQALIGLVLLGALPVAALDMDAKVDITTNSKADIGVVEVTTASETNTTVQAGMTPEERADIVAEIGAPIVITASATDASGDATVTTSSAVKSKTDLQSYARAVVKANAEVKDVSLSDTEVSVGHRVKARIFGVIPATVSVVTTVSSDGSVKVKFPWYVFAGARKAELESKVKTVVQATIPSASAEANVEARLSSKAQAEVLERVAAAIAAEAEARANVSAGVQ